MKVLNGIAFVEAWVCDQPSRGVAYRVLEDQWIDQPGNFDYPIRLIYRIEEHKVSLDHAEATWVASRG